MTLHRALSPLHRALSPLHRALSLSKGAHHRKDC
jgi:hypothetical protein